MTAWEYQYADVKTNEDQGHDTKVAPSADTAEKMAPASMVAGEKVRQERAGRMPRGPRGGRRKPIHACPGHARPTADHGRHSQAPEA